MKNIHISKNRTAIMILAICLLVATYVLIAYLSNLYPFNKVDSTPAPGTQFIKMDKTGTEKQATDNLKKNPQDKVQNTQTDTPSTPPVDTTSGKQQANVLITNVSISNGTVSASGFVTNVVESDGTCEYVFVNGNNRINKPSSVLPSASSTTCATVDFPASELSASGEWSVTLSYNSTESSGVSAARGLQK